MESTSLSSMLLLSSELATHRAAKSPGWGLKSVRHGRNPPQQRVWGLRTPLRTRKLCKTRCEKRDEVQLSEPCSTSLATENLWATESALASCSITRAFSTMVFMLRSLQSYALHMRQLLSTDAQEHQDFQCLLAAAVQSDTHCSLVWLFQQVFATTPKLMLSMMIILANFVTISIANSLEQQLSSSPEDAPSSSSSAAARVERLPKIQKKNIEKDDSSAPDVFISGQFAAGISSTSMIPQDAAPEDQEQSSLMVSMLKQASEDLKLENGRAPHSVEMVPAALVAPVTVEIEPDNYECYDRTELVYQDALSMDQDNPLLLANYAEFLLLVRRDYERAQNLFHLALRADPEDADIICRYAKFQWLVRGDKRAAEEAYRAAMAAEPSNPFYAGCYAHFLWHSGEDQAAAARLSRIQRSDHP